MQCGSREIDKKTLQQKRSNTSARAKTLSHKKRETESDRQTCAIINALPATNHQKRAGRNAPAEQFNNTSNAITNNMTAVNDSRTAKRVSEAVKDLRKVNIQMHLSHFASLGPHCDCINKLGPEPDDKRHRICVVAFTRGSQKWFH